MSDPAKPGEKKPAKTAPQTTPPLPPAPELPDEDPDGNPVAPPNNRHDSIFKAVHAVMLEVVFVQRKAVKDLKYRIVTEQQVIAILRPAMLRHGLILLPTRQRVTHSHNAEYAKDGKVGVLRNVIVESTWDLVHVPTGERWELSSLGEGSDYGDKAVPKANTISLKYLLRHLFMLETGDDPDNTPSEAYLSDRRETRQEARQEQRQTGNTRRDNRPPAQNQRQEQPAEQQGGGGKPRTMSIEESFAAACEAIKTAPDTGKLGDYEKHARKRPFSKDQHEEIRKLVETRRGELSPPAEPPPDEPPTDAPY